ncbi:uncharacterized protein LOC119685472 [Teleopsis dalmanni]|uniref:uncharacterized protein LOC119685472 n=1 Tax=Teleopsis dalmanni TaxID=139649 RepID=UPI0018CD099F|nr:uncharacterized protein LOC119685472 [Teleopsis dalmanni]
MSSPVEEPASNEIEATNTKVAIEVLDDDIASTESREIFAQNIQELEREILTLKEHVNELVEEIAELKRQKKNNLTEILSTIDLLAWQRIKEVTQKKPVDIMLLMEVLKEFGLVEESITSSSTKA